MPAQGHDFIVFGRQAIERNWYASQIFQANGRSSEVFLAARQHPYYALLVDRYDRILAECSVTPRKLWWHDAPRAFVVGDLRVPSLFRGNGYAGLLLLNVQLRFARRRGAIVVAYCPRRHRAARRCYTRAFGAPVQTTRYVYTFASSATIPWWL
jgi:hypothetical protein